MIDLEHELTEHFRRRAADVTPRYDLDAVVRGVPSGAFVGHADRPNRRRMIASSIAMAAAAVAAVVAVVAVRSREDAEIPTRDTSHAPASTGPTGLQTSPFIGGWISFDNDGSSPAMTIAASEGNAVDLVVHDDRASVCGGAPSTMRGVGVVSNGALVIAEPTFVCDDGSTPVALSGPPLDEQLRNLTFHHDDGTDTLTDNFGQVWTRASAATATQSPAASDTTPDSASSDGSPPITPMWPEETLQEVTAAQQGADAGDPAYTWQLDAQLSADDWQQYLLRYPNTIEVVSRFLRDGLGWDDYLPVQGGDTAENSAEFTLIDLVYLRCGPSGVNPLYPDDASRPGVSECAPTIDDTHYETVTLNLSQLARRGADGIWVISHWAAAEPWTQADPSAVEAAATAELDRYLQARISGAGAEGMVGGFRGQPVPYLYATPAGSPFEHSQISLVHGPSWPDGWMEFVVQLEADGGTTLVRQRISGTPGNLQSMPSDTTLNGEPVPVPYALLGGSVTVTAAAPWVPSRLGDVALDRSLELSSERVQLVPGPRPLDPGCAAGSSPQDAAALVAALSADARLVVSPPTTVSVAGLGGVQVDISRAAGASPCPAPDEFGLTSVLAGGDQAGGAGGLFLEDDSRVRLVLLDLPAGSATSLLAIALVAPDASFTSVVDSAAPILASMQIDALGPAASAG